jgi:signal transduction histidine kinase
MAVAAMVGREVDERHRSRMLRLESAAKRIAALIEADLRESTATVPPHRDEIEVQSLFGNICDLLRDRAEAAGVSLLVECAGGTVEADEAEITEALFNLIANAIEATPAGNTVTIQTGFTPLGDHSWCIKDSGCGVSQEMIDALGVPFRTSRPAGSGLGLAVASSIVRAHGGALWIDSVSGAGTTVTIWIPAEGVSS